MEKRFGKPRFGGGRNFSDRRGGFRERRGGGGNFPKPVNEGEEYDVEISEVGTKGDGIARVKNFVIFVAGAKQGQKCRIKIKMVRPKFAVGEIIEKDVELKEPKAKVEEDMEIEEEEIEDIDLE
ncbi:MAG: TRAM domain-containing protein [Candidatus Aenigmatarchaeota archaeon]